MNNGQVTFIVNLLQDINILRPLVYLASHNLNLTSRFLVTTAFRIRDKTGLWQQELSDIANETNSPIHDFENEFQALQVLQDGHGALVAASESHLNAHKPVHDLFRVAPSQYVKITLQHGFECVGFLQSRDQNLAHGSKITFAADIICGWCAPERLTAVAPCQRHKLRVTGPTALLAAPIKKRSGVTPVQGVMERAGLVCENMHSPRLNVAGDFKSEFLDIFEKFCAELAQDGRRITLRPHPGGQYVIKNDVPLLPNVALENSPIYKVDLKQFAYGISAPSSILIDMVLAGIPTAVWQDEDSVMDLDNYEGLTRISTLEKWLRFALDAVGHPEHYLEKQKSFLQRHQLLIARSQVHHAYSSVLQAAARRDKPSMLRSRARARARVLFFAPGYIPTLQLSFLKPLKPDMATGEVVIDVVSEVHLNAEFKGENAAGFEARQSLKSRIDDFRPTVVIFCRWAGPHTAWMQEYLSEQMVPMIFHLDDDLLAIPKEIALDKWEFHNQPERISSIRHLLDHASLVYCSTDRLRQQFQAYGGKAPIRAGAIYCATVPLVAAEHRPVKKIGYMGIGHEGDLATVLPAVLTYLRRNPQVSFEIFGTIPIPQVLAEFGARITQAPKIDSYEQFLQRFVDYQWDIGICPLAPIAFNLLKANTKWVEYTAVGAAVVASRGTVYDKCCAEGCGILATTEQEWLEALEHLTHHPAARSEMVRQAQVKLQREYSPGQLRSQVWSMIELVKDGQIKTATNRQAITKQKKPHINERILFISNAYVPTLQLSFVKPLARLVANGTVNIDFLFEEQLKRKQWRDEGLPSPVSWIKHRFETFRPTLLLFCRYSGPHSDLMLDLAKQHSIPCIYHIDDDLLDIPEDIGHEKYEYHNSPKRLESVRLLLDNSDLVYASTAKLEQHLTSLLIKAPITAGLIYCSGHVINKAVYRSALKIGYMASADHAHNLTQVIGALVRLLRKHPSVSFEFFGSISSPTEFAEFSERIIHAPKIDNYDEFLQRFAESHWDIGICPLNPIHFNLMKANTKWVEYTSVGAAVVASKGTVYDECCSQGCGLLAATEDEWFDALDLLIRDSDARHQQIVRAQEKLINEYSIDTLCEQVLNVFTRAHALHKIN